MGSMTGIPDLSSIQPGIYSLAVRHLVLNGLLRRLGRPSVRDPLWFCHPSRSSWVQQNLEEFRDQLLVFLEGALGIRQGELGALRGWSATSRT